MTKEERERELNKFNMHEQGERLPDLDLGDGKRISGELRTEMRPLIEELISLHGIVEERRPKAIKAIETVLANVRVTLE